MKIFNIRAFDGVSMEPEGAMNTFEQEFIEENTRIDNICKSAGVDSAGFLEKHKELASAYLQAKSRCLSWGIAGRSNFPFSLMEKRGNYAYKHLCALISFKENIESKIKKMATPKLNENDKILHWEKEILRRENIQKKMKEVNSLIRKGQMKDAELLMGGPLVKNCFGHYGFMPFELTNNLAAIKRLQSQIKQSERLQSLDCDGFEFALGRVEYDNVELRWNIFFNEKPDFDQRSSLKSNGFKWSPIRNAWTRGAKTMSISRLKLLLCEEIENGK